MRKVCQNIHSSCFDKLYRVNLDKLENASGFVGNNHFYDDDVCKLVIGTPKYSNIFRFYDLSIPHSVRAEEFLTVFCFAYGICLHARSLYDLCKDIRHVL